MRCILCHFFSSGQQMKITNLPTGENSGPTKYPREKIWDSRNTHEEIFWTHEIPTRKNFRPTKYPRWQDGTRPTRPTIARDPRNLELYFLLSIIMAWIFPRFTIIVLWNQFKATSHSDSKDPISSWIVFPKQARMLPSAKLCAIAKRIKHKSIKNKLYKIWVCRLQHLFWSHKHQV